MGGFGSGRAGWSARGTVEAWRGEFFLGIQDWEMRDLIFPGAVFRQIWSEVDQPEASVDVWIEKVRPVHPALAGLLHDPDSLPDRVQAVLKYRAGRPGGELQLVRDIIVLARSRRGFGGERWRFYCPGCGRRVAELYPQGSYFRCRKCAGLRYRSQGMTRVDRGLEKAVRIRRELGGSGEYAEPEPERPKGMHRKTYERLIEEAYEAEEPYFERLRRGRF